jgi:hypothetical protein
MDGCPTTGVQIPIRAIRTSKGDPQVGWSLPFVVPTCRSYPGEEPRRTGGTQTHRRGGRGRRERPRIRQVASLPHGSVGPRSRTAKMQSC